MRVGVKIGVMVPALLWSGPLRPDQAQFDRGADGEAIDLVSKMVPAADASVFDGLRAVEHALAVSIHAHDTAEDESARGKAARDARASVLVLQRLYEDCLTRNVVIAPDAKPTLADHLEDLAAGRRPRGKKCRSRSQVGSSSRRSVTSAS